MEREPSLLAKCLIGLSFGIACWSLGYSMSTYRYTKLSLEYTQLTTETIKLRMDNVRLQKELSASEQRTAEAIELIKKVHAHRPPEMPLVWPHVKVTDPK